jgi:ABC-type nitrate/sulfonate/bicarbonate transport system permease component
MSGEETTVWPERPLRARTGDAADGTSGARAAARARKRRTSERNLVSLLRVALVILLLVGMHLLNAGFGNLTMPKPADVLAESWEMWTDGTMLRALRESLTVLCLGYLLAAVTGVAGGILLGGFRIVGRVLDPFVHAMNSTPGAAFIPLIIVWFGLYTEAKVIVVWNAALFPILISAAAGIDQSDDDLVEMGRSFGASRATLFWQVMVPDAVPSILSGLRIGAAVATVGTVVSELYMAQSGLGGLLAAAGNRFQMDRYFSVVIVLMALGTLITGLLRVAENRVYGWRVALRDAR